MCISAFPVRQVVLDLGRKPEARFAGAVGGEYLRDEEVNRVSPETLTGRVVLAFMPCTIADTCGICTAALLHLLGQGPCVSSPGTATAHFHHAVIKALCKDHAVLSVILNSHHTTLPHVLGVVSVCTDHMGGSGGRRASSGHLWRPPQSGCSGHAKPNFCHSQQERHDRWVDMPGGTSCDRSP